jgi:hypothetical protein
MSDKPTYEPLTEAELVRMERRITELEHPAFGKPDGWNMLPQRRLIATIRALQAENEGLRSALAWYADDDNYDVEGGDCEWRPGTVLDDNGRRARIALGLPLLQYDAPKEDWHE